jgi:hypothetical protein
MLNDQQRITEAYKLIQEAAPIGIGSQLGTWAAGKAVGALGPLARGSQSRNLGQKDFQREVNKLKIELNRYTGKIGVGKSEISGDILASYLTSKGHKTPTVDTLQDPANADSILSDNDINTYIIQSYKEKARNKPGVGGKPTQQPAPTQPKPAVNQQQAVASIAKSLKNVPLTPRNLLSALVSRGLELTNR